MGQIRRWITSAVVLGALVILAVVLYLILEPLHRDDDDGTGVPVQVGYTVPTAVVPSDRRQPAQARTSGSA